MKFATASAPKVSVCVITFNHARYIRQCLQSLLDQETTFDFEVIVADDCSEDGTQDILREFSARYPDRIRAEFNAKNLGSSENYLHAHSLAKGQYIAYMDGDDYALPGKLQAQSDCLDEHPECNIVWHRIYVLYEATGRMAEDLTRLDQLPKCGFTRADLLRYLTIGGNNSKMYRAEKRDFEIPPFPLIDFFVNVEQIGNGIAIFAGDRPLGVYRAGIGAASRGMVTKVLQKKSLLYFSSKYPQYSVQISTAAIGRFVVATINGNWREMILFGPVLARLFRVGSIPDILSHWKYLRMFRLP